MSVMARVVSRLKAISVLTGALPYFSWTLVSPSTASTASTQELSVADACSAATPQDLRRFVFHQIQDRRRRIFFMGEHHEQPRVLAAQLTILDEMVKQARTRNRPVVLVLEQFNVLQQPMLDRFSAGEVEEGEAVKGLIDEYVEDGAEGFSMPHYAPLLALARSSDVRICGGFPPRSWARVVAREGVESLREQHGEALQRLGFDRYDDLACSSEHVAFIKSMVAGQPPALAVDKQGEDKNAKKGLPSAQAFKDAMLAYTIDREVERCGKEALIMVVTGSGHCEFGFGGPERLRGVTQDEMCIIVCKSKEESTIWKGDAWAQPMHENDRVIADAVFCYDQA